MPKQPKQQGRNKRTITIILIILLLLIIAIGLWFWYQNQSQEDEVSRDLSSGLLPGSSEVDYSEAAEESIRIQINSQPVFETGASEGNLYIGNPEPNQYDMEVIITLEQTGDEIYNSGYIPPGYYIDNDKLDVVLEAGEHAAEDEYTENNEDKNGSGTDGMIDVTIPANGFLWYANEDTAVDGSGNYREDASFDD